MSAFLTFLIDTLLATLMDVLPIMAILFGFQFLVIRRAVPNLKRVLFGFLYVLIGLSLFLMGLEQALFPLGKLMAQQLAAPEFLYGSAVYPEVPHWRDYLWVYVFALMLGFSTAIAEPSLLAVALKAEEVSAGTVSAGGLRVAAAIGVALGIAFGAVRIVLGAPLYGYIIAGYVVVLVQTIYAPKSIVALAYDSGGVTTSTVTVPLVAALGLGLASTVPGRDPLLDGFGLIASACLFPIMAVMGYVQIAQFLSRRRSASPSAAKDDIN